MGLLDRFQSDSSDRSMIKDLEEKFHRAQEERRSYEWQWLLDLAMYLGHQWVTVNRVSRMLQKPVVPSWRVLYVGNMIQPTIRTEFAKLLQTGIVPHAQAASPDPDDLNQARACDALLEYLPTVDGSEEADARESLWALVCGTGIKKIYWDKSAGDVLTEPDTILADSVDEMGQPTQVEQPNPKAGQPQKDDQGNDLHMGEIKVCHVSPFEFYPEPLCETIEEMSWVFHVKVRSPEYVLEHYGVEVKAEDISGNEIVDGQFAALDGDGSAPRHGVIVKEFWRRPGKNYPTGQYVVYIKDKVLDSGDGSQDNPYPECPIPFTSFVHIQVPGRYWGMSVTEQLIDPQRNYNKARSQAIEHRNLVLKPPMLIPDTANIDVEKLTTAPAQKITYSGNVKPEWVVPPPIPESFWKDLQESRSEINEISGVHDVSRSNSNPTDTATGLSLMLEQDDTRQLPTTKSRERAIVAESQHKLALARQFYIEPRVIRVIGEDRRVQVTQFLGKDIPSTVDVRIEAGSSLPKSRVARQEYVRGLVKDGIVTDPRVAARMLELGDVKGLYEDLNRDISQAERENEMMRQGEQPKVRDFHNHDTHIRIHDTFRKGEEYELSAPEQQAIFDLHANEHRVTMLTDPLANLTKATDAMTTPAPSPDMAALEKGAFGASAKGMETSALANP